MRSVQNEIENIFAKTTKSSIKSGFEGADIYIIFDFVFVFLCCQVFFCVSCGVVLMTKKIQIL